MVKTIYPSPSQFKETKNNHKSTVLTISTNFVFSIIPKYPDLRGHGLALVFISTKEMRNLHEHYRYSNFTSSLTI